MIRELQLNPDQHPANQGSDRFTVSGSFPWYQELSLKRTKEEAWAAAETVAAEYRRRDPFGNMAQAFGVLAYGEGEGRRWAGVVNYYHSNT